MAIPDVRESAIRHATDEQVSHIADLYADVLCTLDVCVAEFAVTIR